MTATMMTPALMMAPLTAERPSTRRLANPAPWWERRDLLRRVVGGCPDHWWKPTALRTAACTCPAF
jgi:hypothetical protein